MAAPVNVGDILAGKYQVERVLGVGGMGVVVSAKHLTLGERVAIKFLLPQALAREDVVKRFIQEGRAANRLRGEHIARVFDVGKLESGAPFLVMEYLDGHDLNAVLRDKGPLPIEAAVDYVLQACEALAEAHGAGIIHRDLKPSNLFLIKRLDGSPCVKLIDFGISKFQLPGTEGGEGELTATAVMMGSPLYMAPEQMVSARDVDGRADIWSLGIILHTMLTGATPFRAPSVMQVYELISQGAPPVRNQRKDAPEGLEKVILKCLNKDLQLRYQTVGELADALAEFGPVHARFTADRIIRIVAARKSNASIPPPSDDALVPVAAVTPAGSITKDSAVAKSESKGSDVTPPPAPLSPSSVSQPSGSSAAIDPAATDGPWDQKTHPPTKRTRPVALIVAAATLLIAAPAAFFALRASHGQGAAAATGDTSSAHVAASPPPSATTPAQPTAMDSSVPTVAPAGPAPSASATATTEPSAKPSATPKGGHVHGPAQQGGTKPPAGPTKAKSPDDLFGTQH